MQARNENLTLIHISIGGRSNIGLKFYPNPKIQRVLDTFDDLFWSDQHNIFYLENSKENLKLIYAKFKGKAYINGERFFNKKYTRDDNPILSLDNVRSRDYEDSYRRCPEAYLEKLELMRYSANTAKTYVSCFERFINYYKDEALEEIDEINIKEFLYYLHLKQYSDSYMNIMVNSIKFYYELVLEMPNRFYSLERPKKKQRLPKVLSKEEVASMIKNAGNIKNKCIISVLYSEAILLTLCSLGLRYVSES